MDLEHLTLPDFDNSDVPVRDASTVILVKDAASNPSILMGQRGRIAVFMPEKFVFPGGRVDDDDQQISLSSSMADGCLTRLEKRNDTVSPATLAVTAIRELFEETGLVLGQSGQWDNPPLDWKEFAQAGYLPDASALSFFFRAVTPPGRPRRFDARFFVADATSVANDIEAMPSATDELSHLSWVPLDDVRKLNLAFITELVLAELARHLPSTEAPSAVPFVHNDSMESQVFWL
ncbi:MAG: NUDIX hydrolase [Boseongicola sp.]|nr:NUDIX hydrolase [Boseongicola sp.]